MQKDKKTTVIIPNYNGKKYLENCLLFLKRSKGTAFDVIVVDDASTDESYRIVKESFPRARLIRREENGGFAACVNTGIRASNTKYVVLLNNDTVVEPDFVFELEAAMEKQEKKKSRIFSASAKMLSMNEPEVIDGAGDCYCALGWAFARGKGQSAKRYTAEGEVFSSCAGAAIYDRELLVKLGMFDELHFAYLEDVDICYRARLHGYKSIYAPKAVLYHAGSGSSGSRYNAFKINLSSRNSVYLIAKNMPLLQILINSPLLIAGFLIKSVFFCLKGFGPVYIKGLARGLRLSFSEKGRANKVSFEIRRLPYYLKVQLMLWAGVLKRFTDG